jgi:hypothetical protein
MGLKYNKYPKWHFSAIKAVLDGNELSKENENVHSKAMQAFKIQNRELSTIEWLKPRSQVLAIENWPYGRNMPN